MGLFSRLRELIDDDGGGIAVSAPVSGRLVPLASVPDPMFVEGVMGDGFGIWPDDDCVRAPVSGRVTAVIESRHAIGLTAADGTELIVHVGIDTVEMRGVGFSYLVRVGDEVRVGQRLLSFDRGAIRDAGHPDIVVTVFPGTLEGRRLDDLREPGEIAHGERVCVIGRVEG
uniref:PTS sugar transporter subunit IIA n=1 Tax=Olsenella timonensis TaxID=1805478 RepID=UPI00094E7102|nr:PTS glucose transporter subunit IIA [Olsenella timonensis]